MNNWTGSNNESVCIDPSPFSTWSDWGASQRDLIVLDTNGDVIFDQSVSGGIPSTLAQLVIDAADCDPDLFCADVISCIDGLLYPTSCGPDNCDAPIGECDSSECVDGEFDNTNPCQPSECIDGQWYDIIIDCAEQMGVPCLIVEFTCSRISVVLASPLSSRNFLIFCLSRVVLIISLYSFVDSHIVRYLQDGGW